MAQTIFREKVVNTNGNLPVVGSQAPDFTLTGIDMKDVSLKDFSGKNLVLNIYPSVDTGTCATSTREFNKRAASFNDTAILCISKDLPFAFRRFCGAEGIDKVFTLSDYKHKGFSEDYGMELLDGAFQGLFARAIVVIGKDGKVKHTELVPKINDEPNYDAALKAIG
jgi:thioredoxin-dependent peroxiredoxin